MGGLRVRPMKAGEFPAYRERSIRDYAAAQARAGRWTPSEAEPRAAQLTDELLPEGVGTRGMVLLVAENDSGDRVGVAWIALQNERTTGAWLYSIEIEPDHRGRGFGRALLAEVEREVQARGINSLALSVFGGNEIAQQLYRSTGYVTTAILMSKHLDGHQAE